MKKNIKIVVGILIGLVLIGGGYGLWFKTHQQTSTPQVSSAQTSVITYDGEEGRTVYDLLKSKYQVEASESSFGVMVNSINGLKATSTKFWLYSVNGTQLDVAADQYKTHNTDKVTWEYKGM